MQNAYALDDVDEIQNNSLIKQGIAAIPKILLSPYHYGYMSTVGKGIGQDDLYRPLSVALFAIEYQFFGESPFVGHLVNIILRNY